MTILHVLVRYYSKSISYATICIVKGKKKLGVVLMRHWSHDLTRFEVLSIAMIHQPYCSHDVIIKN